MIAAVLLHEGATRDPPVVASRDEDRVVPDDEQVRLALDVRLLPVALSREWRPLATAVMAEPVLDLTVGIGTPGRSAAAPFDGLGDRLRRSSSRAAERFGRHAREIGADV